MEKKCKKINMDTGIVSGILEKMPGMVALLDEKKKVIYSNREFREVFKDSNPEGKVFGRSISCRGSVEDASGKYQNIVCAACKFNKSIDKVFREKKLQEKDTMLMQIGNKDGEHLKLIQFQINYLDYRDQPFAVVFLNDLTFLGQTVLDHLLNEPDAK